MEGAANKVINQVFSLSVNVDVGRRRTLQCHWLLLLNCVPGHDDDDDDDGDDYDDCGDDGDGFDKEKVKASLQMVGYTGHQKLDFNLREQTSLKSSRI